MSESIFNRIAMLRAERGISRRELAEALDRSRVRDAFDALPAERGGSGVTAFLTVQEGCDKFCTFCVVPYTRGAEWSRPVAAVLAEARELAARGVPAWAWADASTVAREGLRGLRRGRAVVVSDWRFRLAMPLERMVPDRVTGRMDIDGGTGA